MRLPLAERHQCCWVSLYLSSAHRLDHVLQGVPSSITVPHLARFDTEVLRLAHEAVDLPPDTFGGASIAAQLRRARVALPARHCGMGLRETATIAHAAFVGMLNAVMPRLAGLFPPLAHIIGPHAAPSSGQPPYAALLASNCPLAGNLRHAWGALQAFCAARPAVDGGRKRLERGAAEASGGQRDLVAELEGGELLRMRALAAGLPEHDPSRLSFVHATPHTSAAWVHCLPVYRTALPDHLFSGVVAAFMGAPSPYYARFVGHAVHVQGHFARAAYTTPLVDAHGLALAVALRGRQTRLHHRIRDYCFRLAVRSQSVDLHSVVWEPAHILGVQSTDGTGYHAIIPDIKAAYRGTDLLLDVKAQVLSRSRYGPVGSSNLTTSAVLRTPGRPVLRREVAEHSGYLLRAREADGHAGTPAGAVGPVERRLVRDFGPLRPKGKRAAGETHPTPVFMLVVGPFADVSRDFAEWLNICAEQMCAAACQGMSADDASEHLSVVKASVRREVGMMLARESARMHHDMAGELAAGRAQVELEDGVPQLGAAHVGDYFDDDSAAVVVVGAL